METLLAHIDRVVAAQWVRAICGSNPASPSLGFLFYLSETEEVPNGTRDRWFSQRATKSPKTGFKLRQQEQSEYRGAAKTIYQSPAKI